MRLAGECVYYSSNNLPGPGINTGDNFNVVVNKLVTYIGQGAGTVTSVGLSMPSAFTVTNSPVTGAGTLTVTGAGTTSQYIRGDGTLATLPVNSAVNGLSVNSTNVVLGQDVAQVGNPAILTSNREIPFNGFRLGYSGNARFGIGTNFPVTRFHINDTTNTPTFAGNIIAAGRNTMLVNADMVTLASCCTTDINILTTGNDQFNGSEVLLTRARNTTASPVAVQLGDYIGGLKAFGYSGTGMTNNASIRFLVDGTPVGTSVPIATVFGPGGGNSASERMRISSSGNVGIATSIPTARLHLPPGTATASTAPLKIDSGVLLTVPENGAIEQDGTHLYVTTGGVRHQLDRQPSVIPVVSADFDPDGITYTDTSLNNRTYEIFLNEMGRFIYNEVGNQEWDYVVGGGFQVLIPGFDANSNTYHLYIHPKT